MDVRTRPGRTSEGVLVAPTWDAARVAAHGCGAALGSERLALRDAHRRTLARDVRAATDLPPFLSSAMDGWAVSGSGPWLVDGSVLAGFGAGAGCSRACGRDRNGRTGSRRDDRRRPARGRHRASTACCGRGGARTAPAPRRGGGGRGISAHRVGNRARPRAPRSRGRRGCRHGRRRTPSDGPPARPRRRAPRLRDSRRRASAGRARSPGTGVARAARRRLRRRDARADTLDAHLVALDSAVRRGSRGHDRGHGRRPGRSRAPRDRGPIGALIVDSVAVRPGHPMLLATLPGRRWLARPARQPAGGGRRPAHPRWPAGGHVAGPTAARAGRRHRARSDVSAPPHATRLVLAVARTRRRRADDPPRLGNASRPRGRRRLPRRPARRQRGARQPLRWLPLPS